MDGLDGYDGCDFLRSAPIAHIFLISRRRSKPQCGSINLCNPFARSAGIFLRRLTMFRVTQFSGSEFFGFRNPVSCELILARGIQL